MKCIIEAIAVLSDLEAIIIDELNDDGVNPLDYGRQCLMCGKEQRALPTLSDKEWCDCGGELEDTSTLPNTYNYYFNQKLNEVQHEVESILEYINTLRENYPNVVPFGDK